MLAGSLMQSYSGSVEEPSARSVFVWWEEGSAMGKFGTIYFVDDAEGKKKRNKVDTQSLPLSKISDIFCGKQSPIFKAPSLAAVPSDQCFTLASKVFALHLQAESNAVRTAWLNGIKETYTADHAAKKAAAASIAAALPPSYVSSTISSKLLEEGRMFWSVTTRGDVTIAKPIFLWHDPAAGRLGTLYHNTTPGDKTKSSRTGALPVSTITDVFLGKSCPAFQSVAVAEYPANVCFSLVSNPATKAGLHLIAKDEPTRAATLKTITGFWTKKPDAAAAAAAVPSSALITSVQAHPLDRPPSYSSSSGSLLHVGPGAAGGPPPPQSILEEGRMFWSVTHAEGSAQPQAKEIFLWMDPTATPATTTTEDGRIGALLWNDKEGDKSKSTDTGSFSLASLRDVFVGKQTPELQSGLTKLVPTTVCFSLVSDRETKAGLHLIAQDERTRTEAIAAIKRAINMFA
jgi:hypothetical protein